MQDETLIEKYPVLRPERVAEGGRLRRFLAPA